MRGHGTREEEQRGVIFKDQECCEVQCRSARPFNVVSSAVFRLSVVGPRGVIGRHDGGHG